MHPRGEEGKNDPRACRINQHCWRGGRATVALEAKSPQNRRRHVQPVANLVVGLLGHGSACRLDLGGSYLKPVKKRREGTQSPRLCDEDRSHTVFAPPMLTAYSAVVELARHDRPARSTWSRTVEVLAGCGVGSRGASPSDSCRQIE